MTQQTSGFIGNYEDPETGAQYLNAWIQISNILYVPYKYCLIVFDVYLNEGAYSSGKSPVSPNQRVETDYPSTQWDSYFDPDFMDEPEHNLQRMSVNFLVQYLQNERTKVKK